MESIGLMLALIGVFVSVATIFYALWNMFEIIADHLEARERSKSRGCGLAGAD